MMSCIGVCAVLYSYLPSVLSTWTITYETTAIVLNMKVKFKANALYTIAVTTEIAYFARFHNYNFFLGV